MIEGRLLQVTASSWYTGHLHRQHGWFEGLAGGGEPGISEDADAVVHRASGARQPARYVNARVVAALN